MGGGLPEGSALASAVGAEVGTSEGAAVGAGALGGWMGSAGALEQAVIRRPARGGKMSENTRFGIVSAGLALARRGAKVGPPPTFRLLAPIWSFR